MSIYDKVSRQFVSERRKKNKSLISQIGRSVDMMGGFKNLFPQWNNMYVLYWFDNMNKFHVELFPTYKELYEAYNNEWKHSGWDFKAYDPNGNRIVIRKEQ